MLRERMEKDRINHERQLQMQLEAARSQAKELLEEIEVRSQVVLEELDAIRKEKDRDNFSELLSKARLVFNTNMKDMSRQIGAARPSDNSDYVLPRPFQGVDIVHIRNMN